MAAQALPFTLDGNNRAANSILSQLNLQGSLGTLLVYGPIKTTKKRESNYVPAVTNGIRAFTKEKHAAIFSGGKPIDQSKANSSLLGLYHSK